jgi:glycosyltransferase involved in cell wall biosynthesis
VASTTDIVRRTEHPLPIQLVQDSPTEIRESTSLVSVVVPLFNEEATIAALYDQVHAALEAEGLAWEIVYIDDGSTDGSHQELVRLHAAHKNVRVVRLRRNFGKASALSAGFGAAAGDVVVTMDADLQDDPAEIPRLLAKLDEGYDLVSGWKCDRRDPFARRLFSRVYNRMTGVVTGVRLHDMNCGLKIYRAEVLQNVRLYGDLHRFVPVLAHQLGFRTAELPVNHRPRLNGRSRYGLERYARGFFDLLTVAYLGRYRHRPLHFFGGIGMLLGAVGSAILLYLTVLKLEGSAIGGRPLLMLGILLVVVGIQFFSLGLVGEMLTSHHAEKAAATSTDRAYVRDLLR